MNETRLNRNKTCIASWLSNPAMAGRGIFVLAFGLIAGQIAYGEGYLPRVGPPLLRFETVSLPNVAATAKMFTPEMVKADNIPAPAIEPPANTTNNPTTITAAAIPDPGNTSSPIISLPAMTDDSVVTPQMLVDFLKPTAHGGVFVPIKIGFIPPVQTAPAQVGVEPSRAVYKSQ